jgi:hypothetical protein
MRKFFAVFAVAIMAMTLGVLAASPASALGGESLVCGVSPGYSSGSVCYNDAPSSQYTVSFGVANESGSYTYAWSVPSPWSGRIVSGCTSTTDYCQVTAGNRSAEITVSVTLTQGGASETLSATAVMDPWCGNYQC